MSLRARSPDGSSTSPASMAWTSASISRLTVVIRCCPSMTTHVKESSGLPTTAPKKCLCRREATISSMSLKSRSHCFVVQS